jgi:hypothetical protein
MVMICHLVTVLSALTLGVIVGRMWEIRRKYRREQSQRHEAGFTVPTAHLQQP